MLDKRKRVRKGITPGDSRSLWKAVNIAKDKNSSEIPTKMSDGVVEIDEEMIPESFAEHFSDKISGLLSTITIDPNVYIGKQNDGTQ